MSTPVIIRIQQQGFVRIDGYQALQWAVTVPIVEPPEPGPIATTPASYAPLFVVDTRGPLEILLRVATLQDYVNYVQDELHYFEPRGPNGWSMLGYAGAGDTLRITTPPDYWSPVLTPPATMDFRIAQVLPRAHGTGAQVFAGNTMTLSGYTPGDADIGRWCFLNGFTDGSLNGWVQVLAYTGNVLTVNKTFGGGSTGGTWNFPWVQIDSTYPGGEPTSFPTRELNLGWIWYQLTAPFAVATDANQGATSRSSSHNDFVRCLRFTYLGPSLSAANGLFIATTAGITQLQAAAAIDNTAFSTLQTQTVGP